MILVSIVSASDGYILRRYDSTIDRGLTHAGGVDRVTASVVERFRMDPPAETEV